MTPILVYALHCPASEEETVMEAVNASLAKIKRTTSRATHKTLLDGRKPYIYKHFYWNLNRDCGVYFEIIANQDCKGKWLCPRQPNAGLLLFFVLQSHAFKDSQPLKKTAQYVARVLKCLPVEYELIGEGEQRDLVEQQLAKPRG